MCLILVNENTIALHLLRSVYMVFHIFIQIPILYILITLKQRILIISLEFWYLSLHVDGNWNPLNFTRASLQN